MLHYKGEVIMGILLKMNDYYYDASSDSYDTESHKYLPIAMSDDDISTINILISGSSLTIEDLFIKITIDNETFKPIEKFDNFNILSNADYNVYINGIKSNRQLIVQNSDTVFANDIMKYINSIRFNTNLSESYCKVIFSTDKGITWKYWDGARFLNLSTLIPLNDYCNLSSEELLNWNSAIDEIYKKGIDISTINTLNLKYTVTDQIRFAFVLARSKYDSTSELSSCLVNYDEVNHLKKLTKNECQMNLYDSGLLIVPTISNSHIEVYALTRETLKNIPTDSKEYLESPVITNVENGDNTITINWEPVKNCAYYKIFINSNLYDSISDTSFIYTLNEKIDDYYICVRAYPSDTTNYKASKYSNLIYFSTSCFLAYNDNGTEKYIMMPVDGALMKLKVK